MWRKYAGYGLLSTYAFCFFTVVFHTAAHAQAPVKELKKESEVLGAQTQISLVPPDPTPTMFVSNLVEPKNLPAIEPTLAPTATPTPTKDINPTPTTVPTNTPVSSSPTAPQSVANPGGLDAEKLFSMANDYRAARGLPAFQKDEKTCSLAASRSPEVTGEVAAGTLHSGLQARALPYWNTENIISMSSEESAFNWWINDQIHHDAIVSNATYSCVSCTGNSCAQEFTSYQPK